MSTVIRFIIFVPSDSSFTGDYRLDNCEGKGAIDWSPKSSDLTPLDFFLWSHLKTIVYKTQSTDIDEDLFLLVKG